MDGTPNAGLKGNTTVQGVAGCTFLFAMLLAIVVGVWKVVDRVRFGGPVSSAPADRLWNIVLFVLSSALVLGMLSVPVKPRSKEPTTWRESVGKAAKSLPIYALILMVVLWYQRTPPDAANAFGPLLGFFLANIVFDRIPDRLWYEWLSLGRRPGRK